MTQSFNIYVTSDHHFNHFKISEYCHRGFKSLEEMNTKMTKRWNCTIRDQDMVIHLGDIVFTKGNTENIKAAIKGLTGRKILVKGNHDRKSMAYYMTNGFDFVADRFVWRFNGKKILFVHDPKSITFNDYKTCDFVFHGHLHQKGPFVRRKRKCWLVNVSVEKTNYFPVNLVSLIDMILKGDYNGK